MTTKNVRCSVYQCSEMAPRLSGELSFFCLSILKRDLNTKKTPPNIAVCPERLRSMLEYWYIERCSLVFVLNGCSLNWHSARATFSLSMEWKFASWMKQNHSSSFSFLSNNIISLLSRRKKRAYQKASFVCFLRKQGYHVTNFARKTKVSSYKRWRWKNKIITFVSLTY